jgi:hypothetical protein
MSAMIYEGFTEYRTPPEAKIMSITEDTHWLEAELEQSKLNLHEDLSAIASKLHHARDRLKPTSMVREQPLLALGGAMLFGLLLAYWDVPFEDIGKPIARTMLTTAGKQLAAQAIRG